MLLRLQLSTEMGESTKIHDAMLKLLSFSCFIDLETLWHQIGKAFNSVQNGSDMFPKDSKNKPSFSKNYDWVNPRPLTYPLQK